MPFQGTEGQMRWGGSLQWISNTCQSPQWRPSTLSLPYPVHLLELWWWGWSARSCTGATKQRLNGSPVFRWHHLWPLQLRCKKWITAHKGWRNVSALCWATEFRLLIHIGLGALLTPKNLWHHLQSVGGAVTKERNFFVCRRGDSRITAQNLELEVALNQVHPTSAFTQQYIDHILLSKGKALVESSRIFTMSVQ